MNLIKIEKVDLDEMQYKQAWREVKQVVTGYGYDLKKAHEEEGGGYFLKKINSDKEIKVYKNSDNLPDYLFLNGILKHFLNNIVGISYDEYLILKKRSVTK